MLQEGRPSRACKDVLLSNKPWIEAGAQPASAAPQVAKQTLITDSFPVRKGPVGPHKAGKSTGVATTTRGRKRRNPQRAGTDKDGESLREEQEWQGEDEKGHRQQQQEQVNAVAAVHLRRSTRKATSAAPPPPLDATTAPPRDSGSDKLTGRGAGGRPLAKPGATTWRRGCGGAAATAKAPRFLSTWEIDGEEFRAGDNVYVVTTADFDKLPKDEDDEECCVCGRNTNTTQMVECDRCLRGFHFRCLKPTLKALPEGEWLCPDCVQGVTPSSLDRQINTSCQAFLFGDNILGLARISGWVRDAQGEMHVLVRHYRKPEETHLGRQSHHHSREVFLGVEEHQEPAGCVWSRAEVVTPDQFASTPGTDVFICEYEYDDKWKRFRRCLGSEDGPEAASDGDDEWDAAAAAAAGKRRGGDAAPTEESSSSDGDDIDLEDEESDHDLEYKPRNTLDGWVIRKPRPGQQPPARTRGQRAGRANAYKALIDENGTGLLLDQGAVAVPERGPVGQLAAARRALALNNCAGGLPCREAEKKELRHFIGQAVSEDGVSPGVMYICGVPGTGKTACVMEVLASVRAAAQSSGVQLIILNALQLPSPQHVYSKLWERMSGQRYGPSRALRALDESFLSGHRRHMTLLIVDEIDVLITKDQAVLYNLFEWPLQRSAKLAVIGISNTHDLDSRVLPRIASRLSGSKLAFNPYNFEQLREILNSRLQGVTVVAKAAVDFCARKVASTTGDVRRALELLRRATEIAETELAEKQRQRQQAETAASAQADLTNTVGGRQAHLAIREMYGSVHMTLLRSAGLYQKLVLAALLVEVRAQNKAEVTVGALHHRLTSHLALLMRGAALPLSRVVEAAAALGAQRLVLVDAGWQGPGMRVILNVPQDDLVVLLREDPALGPVQSCLA